MDQSPITEPRLKAIEIRQDKLETEIIAQIEYMTLEMHTALQAVNTRLDNLEKDAISIQETLKDHREIALSHGELLRQILQLLQQKSDS